MLVGIQKVRIWNEFYVDPRVVHTSGCRYSRHASLSYDIRYSTSIVSTMPPSCCCLAACFSASAGRVPAPCRALRCVSSVKCQLACQQTRRVPTSTTWCRTQRAQLSVGWLSHQCCPLPIRRSRIILLKSQLFA
jgi:hypothetical protein